MSISSEISRLQTAKASLKTAIENKGVTVPSSTTLSGYADLVSSIPTGGGTSTDATYGYSITGESLPASFAANVALKLWHGTGTHTSPTTSLSWNVLLNSQNQTATAPAGTYSWSCNFGNVPSGYKVNGTSYTPNSDITGTGTSTAGGTATIAFAVEEEVEIAYEVKGATNYPAANGVYSLSSGTAGTTSAVYQNANSWVLLYNGGWVIGSSEYAAQEGGSYYQSPGNADPTTGSWIETGSGQTSTVTVTLAGQESSSSSGGQESSSSSSAGGSFYTLEGFSVTGAGLMFNGDYAPNGTTLNGYPVYENENGCYLYCSFHPYDISYYCWGVGTTTSSFTTYITGANAQPFALEQGTYSTGSGETVTVSWHEGQESSSSSGGQESSSSSSGGGQACIVVTGSGAGTYVLMSGNETDTTGIWQDAAQGRYITYGTSMMATGWHIATVTDVSGQTPSVCLDWDQGAVPSNPTTWSNASFTGNMSVANYQAGGQESSSSSGGSSTGGYVLSGFTAGGDGVEYNGTYTDTGTTNEGQPVYQNEHGRYLYYMMNPNDLGHFMWVVSPSTTGYDDVVTYNEGTLMPGEYTASAMESKITVTLSGGGQEGSSSSGGGSGSNAYTVASGSYAGTYTESSDYNMYSDNGKPLYKRTTGTYYIYYNGSYWAIGQYIMPDMPSMGFSESCKQTPANASSPVGDYMSSGILMATVTSA